MLSRWVRFLYRPSDRWMWAHYVAVKFLPVVEVGVGVAAVDLLGSLTVVRVHR